MSAVRYIYRHHAIHADAAGTFTVDGIRGTFTTIDAARAAIDAACCDEFRELLKVAKPHAKTIRGRPGDAAFVREVTSTATGTAKKAKTATGKNTGRLPELTFEEEAEFMRQFPTFADADLTDAEMRVLMHTLGAAPWYRPAESVDPEGDYTGFTAIRHNARDLHPETTAAQRAERLGNGEHSAAEVARFYGCSAENIRNTKKRAIDQLRLQYRERRDGRIVRRTVTVDLEPTHTCEHCGHGFTATRADARYCSPRCRQAARRAVTDAG